MAIFPSNVPQKQHLYQSISQEEMYRDDMDESRKADPLADPLLISTHESKIDFGPSSEPKTCPFHQASLMEQSSIEDQNKDGARTNLPRTRRTHSQPYCQCHISGIGVLCFIYFVVCAYFVNNIITDISQGTVGTRSWKFPFGIVWEAKIAPHRSPKTFSSPTGNVFWSPCPDSSEYFCSFLSVPLDYSKPGGSSASLALRMLPAAVPVKEQLGYLLVNPGGPGGSSNDLVNRRGKQISTILQHRYHIVGVDGRGVNLTGPSNNCFENQGDAVRLQRDFEALGLPAQTKVLRGSNSQDGSDLTQSQLVNWQSHADSYFEAFDRSCRENGNRDVLETSSTATVARDMKAVIDALGEKQLNYWGFSYGTIVGATFAAMFPDLTGRLWLDGVSDSELYTNDLWEWGRVGMNNTQDVWSAFFKACAQSGPKGCALAREEKHPDLSTASAIESRVREMILKLVDEPVAVGSSKFGPGVVEAGAVHYRIWKYLYAPSKWPELAEALADLERGNGTKMYEGANSNNDELARKDPTQNAFHRKTTSSFMESTPIMCLDSDPKAVATMSDSASMSSYAQSLAEISPTGQHWALWIGACRQWTSRAREAYRGPWTVQDGLRRTKNKIVFFSMEFDPVTPLISARKMAQGFGNDSATLVIQRDGLGHCSSAHPSLCTAKLIRNFFNKDVVPDFGTECSTDEGFLFPHPDRKWTPSSSLNAAENEIEDLDLLRAIRQLGMKPPIGMEHGF